MLARQQPVENHLVGLACARSHREHCFVVDASRRARIHGAKRPTIWYADPDSPSRVAGLFGDRRPAAIVRLVIAVVVDAINSKAVRSLSHIGQESIKAVSPMGTDFNATTTIVGDVVQFLAAVTSADHPIPRPIGSRPGSALRASPRTLAYLRVSHRAPLARCLGQSRGGRFRRLPGSPQSIQQFVGMG